MIKLACTNNLTFMNKKIESDRESCYNEMYKFIRLNIPKGRIYHGIKESHNDG
jgi:hypothetical protein